MFELTNELLVKLLIFILVFFVTTLVFQRFMKQKPVAVLSGILVGIIAVRYLSFSQIQIALDSFGWLGIVLALAVPFLIVFYFVYSISASSLVRRTVWVLYGLMVYFIMGERVNADTLMFFVFVAVLILVLADKWIKGRISWVKNKKR